MNTTASSYHSADARIIGTLGRYAIEAALHEVDLPDHSLHAFHYVRDPGEPTPRSTFLRAITLPDDHTYIVDLRHLAPALRLEFPGALERDRPGLVKYTLRPLYPTAAALRRVVLDRWRACGHSDQTLEQALQARAA